MSTENSMVMIKLLIQFIKCIIKMNTTCYDDPTKDHLGPATSAIVLDNLAHETLLKLWDEIRSDLILATGGTRISLYDITPEVLHRDTDDDIQMSEFALQKNVPLGFADLGLLATVELQIIHVYDKSRVVVLSIDSNKIMLMRIIRNFHSYSESFQTAISRIDSNETSVIPTLQSNHPIIHVQFNQPIDYPGETIVHRSYPILQYLTDNRIS
ncbi:unnamed protein product [Rotaria magnacalcarata]